MPNVRSTFKCIRSKKLAGLITEKVCLLLKVFLSLLNISNIMGDCSLSTVLFGHGVNALPTHISLWISHFSNKSNCPIIANIGNKSKKGQASIQLWHICAHTVHSVPECLFLFIRTLIAVKILTVKMNYNKMKKHIVLHLQSSNSY